MNPQVPNLLFASDAPISSDLTGGLVSQQIVRLIDAGKTTFIYTPAKELLAAGFFKRPDVEPAQILVKPRERVAVRFGPLLAWPMALGLWINSEWVFRLKWLIHLRWLQDKSFSLAWVTLQGPSSLILFSVLKKYVRAPFVVQVWDHIDWWLYSNHVPRFLRAVYVKKFERVLCAADFVICPSPAYAKSLSDRFGLKTEALIFPSQMENLVADKIDLPTDHWVIGFAGQTYAEGEFRELIELLERNRWVIEGRPVVLKLMGRDFGSWPIPEAHRKVTGWLDQRQLIAELRGCHFLYCPYPREVEMHQIARFSFPSKMVNYLSAGRPILLHGPGYSAPATWMAGLRQIHSVTALSTDDLSRMIKLSLMTGSEQNARQNEAKDFVQRELSLEVFAKRLAGVVNQLCGAIKP